MCAVEIAVGVRLVGWRERGIYQAFYLKSLPPILDIPMANGAERVQRLTREAFHRLRNDHEQFLDAYESE